MADAIRTPPRFVPTLTAVVDEPLPPMPAQAVPADAARSPGSVGAPPLVPVTDASVAPPAALDEAPAVPLVPTVAQIALSPGAEAAAFRLEEELLHRVLQRVDLSLEERLTDTVSAAVQHQLDVMVPRLRTEIEQVLRTLVVEALSLELSESTGSAPTSPPPPLG